MGTDVDGSGPVDEFHEFLLARLHHASHYGIKLALCGSGQNGVSNAAADVVYLFSLLPAYVNLFVHIDCDAGLCHAFKKGEEKLSHALHYRLLLRLAGLAV